jgi:hypothetical protein
MGQRAYLLIRTATTETELFEANNFLPFFWLTLLNQAALTQVAPSWQYAHNLWQVDSLEQEEYANRRPSPTNLVIPKPELLANSARARHMLQASQPELLTAYEEFSSYLLTQVPGEDDQIHLDIFALTAFTSPSELLQSLGEQLAAFEQQQPEKLDNNGPGLVLLTGFPSSVPAPGPAYPQLEALWASSRPLPPADPLAKAKNKRVWLPVAGLLLLHISYQGYQHEGVTWLVAGLALLGAIATGWGMARLLALPRKR